LGMPEGLPTILFKLRGASWSREADVDSGLVRPLLAALGWDLSSSNTEVWIPLTEDMARLWSYSSKRMRRDYVLSLQAGQMIHIEVKHSWGTPSSDVEALLAQINRNNWSETGSDGWKKDLALLLWGARSQSGRRAALIDERRLLVFDWDAGWKLIAAVNLFADSADRVCGALRLLERTTTGRMPA
jgi:hypothetical protein